MILNDVYGNKNVLSMQNIFFVFSLENFEKCQRNLTRLHNICLRASCGMPAFPPSPWPGSGPDLRLSRLCEVLLDRGINVSFYHGSAARRGKSEGRVLVWAGVAVYCEREAHVSFVMRLVCCADLWLSDVLSHRKSSLTSHRGEAVREKEAWGRERKRRKL